METDTPFRHFLALGDSISIDLYPGLDTAEREGLPLPPEGLGAASLLHENDDDRWPEFAGRDLTSLDPDIGRTDLTEDGATTTRVLGIQLPRVPDDLEEPALVTLTIGGNDLLALLDLGPWRPEPPRTESREAAVGKVVLLVERIVDRIRSRLPASTVLLATVYDPSDGTGKLEEGGVVRPEALETLHAFNDAVRGMEDAPRLRVVDLHDHFIGHGLTEPDPAERWYWVHSIIEPSARGAHEVRRLWWEAIAGRDGDGQLPSSSR